MLVMLQTFANPNKTYKQKDAESQQEHNRNDGGSPVVKSVVVFTSDSLVNTSISKVDQIIYGDDSYTHIADFACDSAVDLMLCLALVFPTEHFSHLKVPVSEQEVPILPECIT
jgi:hypothetical protein